MIFARFTAFIKPQTQELPKLTPTTDIFPIPGITSSTTQNAVSAVQGTAQDTGPITTKEPLAEEKKTEKKEEKKPKGVPLSQHLQKHPLPSAEWCFSLMEQVCDKVKEAHKAKKTLGTLALEKIRLEQHPKLTDIVGLEVGSGKKTAEILQAEREAQLNYWRKSSVYAAPETRQAESLPELQVDGRADVYSLGIVLYEMLAGCVPTSYPPLSLQEANPHYKGFDGLDEIMQTALSPDPEDRYPSVQHFWDAIQEAKEAAKAPKSLKWSDIRKTIKKKLRKYLRKKMLKLLQKEIGLWIKRGFGSKNKGAQEGSKQGAKQAGKQAADQAAQQMAQTVAQKVGAMMYQTAAQSAAAAATTTATATAASTTVAIATQGALLVAGVSLGAVVGSYGVEAIRPLPVIQQTIQRQAPPSAVSISKKNPNSPNGPNGPNGLNGPNGPNGQSRPAVLPQTTTIPQAMVGAVVSQPTVVAESCLPNWTQVTLAPSQREQMRAMLAQGTVRKYKTFLCIPPDAQQAMFEYPGKVLCILRISGRTPKKISIRLQKDPDTILAPDYCLMP